MNKVSTKAEVRFLLQDADWISPVARDRLRELYANRINQEGELVVSSSRFRSQAQNVEDCLAKLLEMIEAASRRPKRRAPTSPTRASREKRLLAKRARGTQKRERRWRPGGENG